MDEEVTPALELDNQILAAAADRPNLLALEGGRDRLRRLGSRESRVGDLDTLEPAPRETRLEPGADRLDFWELGHLESPPRQAMTSSTIGRSSGSSGPIR
jgi:hypothetical protein